MSMSKFVAAELKLARTGRLPALLTYLKTWLPRCNPAYHLTRNSFKTGNVWPCIELYTNTDDYENLNTVVCVNKQYYESPYDRTYFVYSEDTVYLKSILPSSRAIDWTRKALMFEAVPENVVSTIEDICFRKGYLLHFKDFCYFYHDPNRSAYKMNLALPNGLKCGPKLTPEFAPKLKEIWGSTSSTPSPIFTKTLEHRPHVAIYNEKPISWIIYKELGDMGYGYTAPEFRHKALSLLSYIQLTSELRACGELHEPYFILLPEVEPVLKKFGFSRLTDEKFSWLMFRKII